MDTLKHSNRIKNLDILKGIGIIFMIAGHVTFGDKFDYYIHAFNMPLFFIVSGYLYKVNKDKKFIKVVAKKAKSLLIPYFSFAFLHYILWILVNFNSNENLIEPIKHIFGVNYAGIPVAGALWFLTAIFFTEIIYELLQRVVKNKYILGVLIIILALLGNFINIRLPFSIDSALVGLGFYFLGISFRKIKNVDSILNQKFIVIILLFLINIFLIFTNGYVNMRTGEYSNIILFYINATLGTYLYWCISYKLEKIFDRNKLKCLISNLIFIGENSIVYLCLNQLVIYIFSALLGKIVSNQIAFKAISFIVVLLALKIIAIIIDNTYLRILIGKNLNKGKSTIVERE